MNYDKIGKFIQEKRKEKNLTQKELGEKIYASRSAISKWELGNGIPSDINLEAICELFDVTEEWLLDRDDLKDIANKIERLLNQKEKDYILEYYSEFNNEECGKWNTSLKSKWYDYKINEYFVNNLYIKIKILLLPQQASPFPHYLKAKQYFLLLLLTH